MSDKYDILLQKYNKAIAKAKDLQEQLTLKKEQWQTREDEFNISSKLIRELCESILAKSPTQNSLGKSKSWDSLELNEMIRLSQKVLKEYNDERTNLMRKLSDELEERGRIIREQEEDIQFLKHHRGKAKEEATEDDLGEDEDKDILKEHKEEVEKQKQSEENKQKAKSKMSPKLQDKIDKGEIDVEIVKEMKKDIREGVATIEFEDEDEIVEGDKSEELHKDMMKNNITAKVTPRSMRTFHNPKEIKRRQEMRHEVEDQVYSEKYKDLIEKMTEDMWVFIKIIGETGISRQQELAAKIVDEMMSAGTNISSRQVLAKLKDMDQIGLIHRENITTPFSVMTVLTLTAEGAHLYKKKYNTEYHIPEFDRIIAEHTTLEHGYGILTCAEKIKEIKIDNKKIYVRVDIWNRKKALNAGDADGHSNIQYIPDIVCIDQHNNRTYIEYELNHHTDGNLSNKCNKMVMVGIDKLNFIAPNKETAQNMCQRIQDWVKTKGASEITRRLTVRVTTAKAIEGHDLRQDREWMFVYKPMQDKAFKENF